MREEIGVWAVHPHYQAIWKKIRYEDQDFFPRSVAGGLLGGAEEHSRRIVSTRVIVACCIAAVMVGALAFIRQGAREEKEAPSVRPNVFELQTVDRLAKNEREMELVKGILFGLVETVTRIDGKISVPQEASPVGSKETESARVNVNLAHLRAGPGKERETVALVPRGTNLLITGGSDEWAKVQSPFGTEAWISEDVITRDQVE